MSNGKLFVIALSVAVLSYSMMKHQSAGPETDHLIRVVLSDVDIPKGRRLTRADIGPGEVPESYLAPSTVLAADVDTILGHPVVRDIPRGQQVSWNDFSNTATELSRDIPMGRRAFTIQVDPTSTHAGQLNPGDRVDVLGVFEHTDEAACKTLLQNVRVIAVGGQRLNHLAPLSDSSVTLDLDPEQCQILALTRGTAEILLTLRHPSDVETVQARPLKESDMGEVTFKLPGAAK